MTDLQTGAHLAIDEDVEVAAASVIKLPVLAAVFQAQAYGRLTLDDHVILERRHQVSGSGVLQHLTPGIAMTLRDAATLMIIISDNPAFEICLDSVGGVHAVNQLSRDLGLARTVLKRRLTDPAPGLDGREFAVTSAADTCRLLALISSGKATSPEHSADMLGILRRQQSRDKLSRALHWSERDGRAGDREESWVASKDGENAYRGVRNDAAIMCRRGRSLAVAAFTELGELAVSGDHPGNLLLGRIGALVWDWLGDTPGKARDEGSRG